MTFLITAELHASWIIFINSVNSFLKFDSCSHWNISQFIFSLRMYPWLSFHGVVQFKTLCSICNTSIFTCLWKVSLTFRRFCYTNILSRYYRSEGLFCVCTVVYLEYFKVKHILNRRWWNEIVLWKELYLVNTQMDATFGGGGDIVNLYETFCWVLRRQIKIKNDQNIYSLFWDYPNLVCWSSKKHY